MDGWSLAISFVALVVAAYAAWFAYQEKEAVKETLQVMREQLKDERTPTFTGSVEVHRGGDVAWYRLHLRLDSPWSLSKLHVEIVDGKGVTFTPSQKGVDPAATAPILEATGTALQPGDENVWRVALDDDRSADMRLRVQTADAEHRHWTRIVEVKLPPRPGSWGGVDLARTPILPPSS